MKSLHRELANGLLAAFLLAACRAAPPPPADEGAKVSGDTLTLNPADSAGIVTVKASAAVPRVLRLPGRLVWNEDATVRVFSPFAGRVTRIAVKTGEHVAAGQVLAVLSSADYGAAQSDYRKAAALLELAKKARDRSRDLLAHGVAAAKDTEQAESDYLNAEAEAQRAQARLKLAGDRGGAVDQSYPLRSPIAGIVVDRTLNPGQEVVPDQSGAPLFVVTDPTTLWAQLDAHESNLAALHPGQPLSLRSGEYPDQTFPGELIQIADFVDPATRSIRLRGRVANADRQLKGEMYVTAELPLSGTTATAAVPAAAVLLIGNTHYVFVAHAATQSAIQFERRAVEVEAESAGLVPVDSGVQPGEAVVSGGALYLQQLFAANTP